MRTLRLSEAEADAHIDRLLSAQERVVPQNRAALAERGKARGLAIASHDDETAEHVADAAALGISVTEFPTTLAAARAARDNDMKVIMGAPNLLRGGHHSGNFSGSEERRVGKGCVITVQFRWAPYL